MVPVLYFEGMIILITVMCSCLEGSTPDYVYIQGLQHDEPHLSKTVIYIAKCHNLVCKFDTFTH